MVGAVDQQQGLGEDLVFLMGRPPVREFLEFVKVQALDPATVDVGALTSEWRAANDRVRVLERTEKGIADGAKVDAVDASLAKWAEGVSVDPVVKKAFEALPWKVGVVPLDSLVVYQKRIGLPHVARVRAALGDRPTREAVFNLCLPVGAQVRQRPFGLCLRQMAGCSCRHRTIFGFLRVSSWALRR
jgi:hypothetical protein